MHLGLTLSLGSTGAGGDTPPPDGTTSVNGFSSDADTSSGSDATGRSYMVSQPGMDLTAITPATTTTAGRLSATQYLVGGMQKNPARTSSSLANQGYDARALEEASPNYDAALTVSLPVATAAGDTFVHGVPNTGSRDGGDPYNTAYKTLHVMAGALPANAVMKSTVGPYKAGEPEYYVVDMPALLARCKNLDATGISIAPASVVLQSLGLHAPVFAQNSATIRVTGYEPFMPVGIKGRAISGNNVQYGADIAEGFGHAGIGLHYDTWTSAEKEAVLWALIRHGVEWVFPVIASGNKIAADGGHQSFWQLAGIVALMACGREDEIATFMADTGGGNWDGFFEATDTIRADFITQHSDSTKPAGSRARTLGAQPGGTTLRVPMGTGDQDQTNIPAGSGVLRGGRIVARTSALLTLADSGTVDVAVDVAPVPAFAASDVISFTPPIGAMQRGRHEWGQRGGYGPSGSTDGREYISSSVANQYRDIQPNMGAMASLRAFGVMHPTLHAPWGYLRDTSGKSGEGYPYPTNDYPTNVEYFNGLDGNQYTLWPGGFQNIVKQFDAFEQSEVADGVAAITIDGYGDAGSTATNVLDGEVAGVFNGYTFAPTSVRGTATPGSEVQIRIVDADDNTTIIEDWFKANPTDATGRWEAVYDLPKSDKWHHIQYRYVGDVSFSTFTTKTGVGYRFMPLGQSQVAIMTNSNGVNHEILPANIDQASYYAWESYHAGETPVAESMSILDTVTSGSDGIAAMVNQICKHITDGTKFQIARKAVGGQSVTQTLTLSNQYNELVEKFERGNGFNVIHENWDTANIGGDTTTGGKDIDQLLGIDMHGITPIGGTLTDLARPDFKFVAGYATRNASTSNDALYSHYGGLRAQELGLNVGYPIIHYQIENAGGPHALSTGDGNINMGGMMGLAITRALGLHSIVNPHFALDDGELSADKKTMTLTPTLYGGTLADNADLKMFSVSTDNNSTQLDPSTYNAQAYNDLIHFTKNDASDWASVPDDLYAKPLYNGPDNTGPFSIAFEQEIVDGLPLVTMPNVIRPMVAVGRLDAVTGHFRLNAATNDFSQSLTNPTLPSSAGAVLQSAESRQMTNADPSTSGRTHFVRPDTATYEGEIDASDIVSFFSIDGTVYGSDTAANDEYLIFSAMLGLNADASGWNSHSAFSAASSQPTDSQPSGGLWTAASAGFPGAKDQIQASIYTQNGSADRWRSAAFSAARFNSDLVVFRLTDLDASSAIAGNGTTSVTLTSVPAGSIIFAQAQKASGTVTWGGGVTEERAFTETVGASRHVSTAMGTGSGTVTITASGATGMVAVAIPPA